ncbi:MAG: sensor histidine kinase [Gaiellales bacterium]
MSVALPLLLLLVGLAVGWLLARRRGPVTPEQGVEVPVEVDARWQVDVRAICDAVPTAAILADAAGLVLHVNAAATLDFPTLVRGADLGSISASLAEIVRRSCAGEEVSTQERIFLGDPPRSLRVTSVVFAGGVITAFYDVTEDVDFEEARRTFSAAVSHELRTPLARILGLAESLALPNTDDEREELVTQIEHEVDGMRKLIDEMLLLAALDRGRLAVADGVVDASDVAFDIVEAAKQRRIGRGRDIALSAPTRVEVPVAPRLFEVVIQNLVDNALIHGGPDAVVRVSVTREDEHASIVVSDSGIGIPAQHLPFVFQRFYRGEASRTGPGSGLGLALVKHIVEAHGGTVIAESDGATGTTLRVTLPLAP